MRKFKLFYYFCLTPLILILVQNTRAQAACDDPKNQLETVLGCVPKDNPLPDLMNKAYTWVVGIAGVIATVMLIYAGYLYMVSGGNPQTVQKAKEIIYITLGALALLILGKVLFVLIIGYYPAS